MSLDLCHFGKEHMVWDPEHSHCLTVGHWRDRNGGKDRGIYGNFPPE